MRRSKPKKARKDLLVSRVIDFPWLATDTIDPLRIQASNPQRLVARDGGDRGSCDRTKRHRDALLDPIVANTKPEPVRPPPPRKKRKVSPQEADPAGRDGGVLGLGGRPPLLNCQRALLHAVMG